MKSVSVTRWSAHYKSVSALKKDTEVFYKLWHIFFEDSEEESECKRDAKKLFYKLVKLEYEILTVFPNISTALKLYLIMPITSCEAERNFSKLAFIKS